MKKGFLFVLLLVSLFFVNINVKAVGVGTVTVIDALDAEMHVVEYGNAYQSVDGMEFIKSTNTLVLDGVNVRQLFIQDIEGAFTLELHGVNHLENLYISNSDVKITGDGTLIVDSTEMTVNPPVASVYMDGTKAFLRIANEATVKIYSNTNVIAYLDNRDNKTVRLIFENGMDVTDQLVFRSHVGSPTYQSEIGDFELRLKELVIEPKAEEPKEEPKEEINNPYTGNGMMLVIDAIILLGVLGFAIKTMKKA